MVHYDINCAASKIIVREVYPSGFYQWRIQDFPEGGRQPQRLVRQPIILAISSWKLHEIEKHWTKREERILAPPWIRQCLCV